MADEVEASTSKMAATKSKKSINSKIKLELKWPTEMEVDLIDEVYSYPNIWNPSNPLYAKKTKKRLSFQEISERMMDKWPLHKSILEPGMIMAKFQNIRTYYKKEKRKFEKLKSGSGADDFVPKYVHFSRLQFLDDTIEPTDSTSNFELVEVRIITAPDCDNSSVVSNQWYPEDNVNDPVNSALQIINQEDPPPTSSNQDSMVESPVAELSHVTSDRGAEIQHSDSASLPHYPVIEASPPIQPSPGPSSKNVKNTPTAPPPPKRRRKVNLEEEQFFINMNKCLGAASTPKTINDTFCAYLAQELNGLSCPQKEAKLRRKLRNVMDEFFDSEIDV